MEEDVSAKTVLILGAGPIGLFATGIARASGASLIIVSDPNNYRLAISKKMGAHMALNPRERDITPLILEATKKNVPVNYLGKKKKSWKVKELMKVNLENSFLN